MDQTKIVQRGRPLAIGAAKAENVTIRMPPELATQVDAHASEQGITRSEAARMLIERGLLSWRAALQRGGV